MEGHEIPVAAPPPTGHRFMSPVSPEVLLLVPSVGLAWLLFGAEGAAVAAAAGLPVAMMVWRRGRLRTAPARPAPPADINARSRLLATLETAVAEVSASGKSAACIILGLDEPAHITEAYGPTVCERVGGRIPERLSGALREDDAVLRLDATTFAITLSPKRRMDLEAVIQVASRLRAALDEPFSIDSMSVYVSASVGFCLTTRAPVLTAQALLEATELAFADARRNGPAGLRSYSPDLSRAAYARHALRDGIEAALESGQIIAYFQPQISTDDGDLTGFEALARWQHPERGVLSPAEFLPTVLEAGLGERLGEVMLRQSLIALRDWDRAGLAVPSVALNVSAIELRNPNLVARIRWELDRFDLTPERLTVEILESVIANTDSDMVVRNISELAKLGCGIDLDDFGTGNASLAAVRRFSAGRIKIDRSYVTRVDTDQAQQRMVAAILSMAERLGLETVAEGVETIGEHAHLAQLGCTHVQGFAIARPMPFGATAEWLAGHRAKLASTPGLTSRAG